MILFYFSSPIRKDVCLSGICPTGKHHVQSSFTFLRHKVEQLGHYSFTTIAVLPPANIVRTFQHPILKVLLGLANDTFRPCASNWLSPEAIICETSSGVSQVTVSIPSKASVIDITVFVIKIFLGEWVINPKPNLITQRAGRLLLVWTLTIDLSGMGGKTRRNKSPASISLRFTESHKPLNHDKVAVTTERKIYHIDRGKQRNALQ